MMQFPVLLKSSHNLRSMHAIELNPPALFLDNLIAELRVLVEEEAPKLANVAYRTCMLEKIVIQIGTLHTVCLSSHQRAQSRLTT